MASKRDRQKAAKMIDEAREVMNSGGVHWTQGSYREQIGTWEPEFDESLGYNDNRNCRFCAIGGLRAAGGFSRPDSRASDPIYRLAVEALAEAAAKRKTAKVYVSDEHDYWTGRHARKPIAEAPVPEVEDVVIEWNDHPARTWKQVDNGFKRAAALLRS